MKGLFSGRQIRLLASKGDKVTRSQTATNAIKAITAKYGSLKDEEKYFHLGKGNWRKYSLSNDKKRTGKLAQSKEEWRQQPHKLDFQGIDTKVEGSGVKKKTRTATQRKAKSVKPATPKRVLSVTSLKQSSRLSGRSRKTGLKAVGKPALKTIEKPEIKQKPKELYQTRFIDYLKSTNCKDEFRHYVMNHEMALHKALTNANKIPASVREDYTIDMKGYHIKNIKLTNKSHNEAYQYYLNAQKKYQKYSMGKIKHPSRLSGRSNKSNLSNSNKPVLKTVEKPKAKTKATLNLKAALNKLPAGKKLSGRKERIVPDKGISVVFGKNTEYPVKATIVGNDIKVTCYEKDVKRYTSTLKISEWENIRKNMDNFGFYSNRILKTRTPNEFKDLYEKSSYNQVMAVDSVYHTYQNKLPEKKIKATLKREPGTFEHFGKNLLKGKYKDEFANLRSGITKVLKEKYPDQLFMIVSGGYYNKSADVYWANGPSEPSVRKLGLGISGSDWGSEGISRDIKWNRVSEEKLRKLINGIEHNKALKTKAKVSYTRKLKASDLEAPKPVVKMPAKIPTKTPAAVPKKTIKGRKAKSQMQIKHTPILKTGRPKPKVYKGFLVTGDTYPLKNTIKAMGGKWNGGLKGWVVPPTSAKAINKLSKEKRLSVTALKTEEDVYRRISAAERLDLRKERYEKKGERWGHSAAKLKKEADDYHKRSHDLVNDIPFGQPVLVGHYSEKSHRNRLDKAWNLLGKAVHADEAAEEKSRKSRIISRVADNLGSAADLYGRIAKTEKELNHARNKVVKAEENKRWAISRKDSSEADRYDAEAKYWAKRAENIQADLNSFKARLPASAVEKPSYGITMTMLGGTKLKPLVGATSIAKRYHNKNLKGGNFAIEVRKGNNGVELRGYHNTDGIIYSLRVGPLFGVGATVINQENYKEFKLEQLVIIVKRALGA